MAEKKYASTAAISELWDNTKAYVPNAADETDVADMLEELGLDGIRPDGTINITENGTYDVTNKATAMVNVSGSEEWDFLDVSNPIGAITSTLQNITGYRAYERTGITSLNLPNATNINTSSFYGCTGLRVVTFGSRCKLGSNVFYGCTNLERINVDADYYIENYSGSTFKGCVKLVGAVIKRQTEWRWLGSGNVFADCTNLKYVDMGGTSTVLTGNSFLNATNFDTLIIRKNSNSITLDNINAFSGTPFDENGTGGTLYVPQDLISAYEAATNWSTILGYTNNQILPIEGSIYETQYADGTPIS